MMHLVLVFLIIAIGAFLQSAIGFGFGVFCMACRIFFRTGRR